MKQIKFKHLATLGLCCSLLVNSFTGVTAVAETVTIESSPTTESTNESAEERTIRPEEKEKTLELSNNETKEEKQEEATAVQEQKQAENLDKQVITEPMNPYSSVFRVDNQRALSTVSFPARSFQIYFVDEGGGIIDPSMVTMSAQSQVHSLTRPNGANTPIVVGPKRWTDLIFTNVSNSKRFSIPSYTTQYNSAVETNEYLRTFYGVANIKITIPKKYEKIDYLPSSYYKGSSYPIPVNRSYNMATGALNGVVSAEYFNLVPDTQSYTYKEYRTSADGSGLSAGYYDEDTFQTRLFGTTDTMYYYLTNRRVTENFVDVSGAKIIPPTGFTQGNQKVVDTDNFTYTSSKSLPDTYQANGKTYKFKGWYKGTDKTALKTTKTPSYAVTYDDNDDMTAVYEEVVPKTVTVPAVDYLFGFINEKGVYVYDAKLTATITEVSGGTVKNGSAITSVPEGVFQKLTIPSKALTYTETSPVFYGVTKANVQVPKYYKQPTVKPGSYFTGPLGGYPMATIAL
ncbi:hypothetical protein EPB68_04945 [Enterococcus faecalis]|nr:hypothetical protein EPB68_04945 [Enterococcus faecalis]